MMPQEGRCRRPSRGLAEAAPAAPAAGKAMLQRKVHGGQGQFCIKKGRRPPRHRAGLDIAYLVCRFFTIPTQSLSALRGSGAISRTIP